MSKEIENINKSKKILLILIIIIVIFSILLIVSENFGNFSKVKLKKNDKTIFSISDLVVDDLKYSDNEEKVKKVMGKPKKEKSLVKGIYKYKELHYDGLVLTLKENYSDYMLVKAEITSNKYKTSRKIKVKDKILNVIKKYNVENKVGTYIYGNYSIDALSESEITENIYFGVRNNKELLYINRDSVIEDTKTNIARLNISYKYGKITKITWSYDVE